MYVVWDEKYGLAYRGHIYETAEAAEKVRANVVWHSRERYVVREVVLAEKKEVARG